MGYKLIAFDMDGTLLNSRKEISPRTMEAIARAASAGKTVALDTGRCIPELTPYLGSIPGLRYAVCGSGSMVYDVEARRVVRSRPIPVELVRKILDASRLEDLMVHILSERSVVESSKIERMEHFGLGRFRPLFERIVTPVEDVYAWYESNPVPLEKINLHHATAEGRGRTRGRLAPLGLSLADELESSLEISAPGVDKGSGLRELCGILGISPDECIAVGDSYNDLEMLRTAGLPLAMGNANESARSLARAVLPDCDHDGCAEAIDKYLLA